MRSLLMSMFMLVVVSKATDPQFSTVFKQHDGKYACYRGPAILTTNIERTHLLVFADGRLIDSCTSFRDNRLKNRNSPNENGGLAMRRSLDGGATWLPQETLYSGNIDFYTVVWDSTSNTVYLMLEEPGTILVFISRDEGVTWLDPVPLNVRPLPPLSSSIRPAMGHGIEIDGALCKSDNCSDAGTLLLPFLCQSGSDYFGNNDACPTCYACVLKSPIPKKNEDRVWNFTGVAQQYTREAQFVQTINTGTGPSHIYSNERNFSPSPGHRYYARSTTGADQFTEFGIDSSLVEPVTAAWTGVVCSIQRVSTTPSRILFSGPANATVRANLTLRISYDEAHTWAVSRVLYPGPSAYSDIAVLGNGDSVALVFENGEETFADRISVAIVPVSWIENNPHKNPASTIL